MHRKGAGRGTGPLSFAVLARPPLGAPSRTANVPLMRIRALAAAIAVVAAVTPSAAPAAQSGPRSYPKFTYERTRVEMRDGVELSVDIWRPVTPKGVEVPVILSLTPYHSLYYALDRNETDLPGGDAALLDRKSTRLNSSHL